MNTITPDNSVSEAKKNPGERLADMRQQQGYTLEYVADKLRLRVRIIELIENNQFSLLPEPVFIKGYLRAYAKLLGISPEPYLAVFNEQYVFEKKSERVLKQSKKKSHKIEHSIRWLSILFTLGLLILAGVWWQKTKDVQPVFPAETTPTDLSLNQTISKLQLADASQIQSLLMPKAEMTPLEKAVE